MKFYAAQSSFFLFEKKKRDLKCFTSEIDFCESHSWNEVPSEWN